MKYGSVGLVALAKTPGGARRQKCLSNRLFTTQIPLDCLLEWFRAHRTIMMFPKINYVYFDALRVAKAARSESVRILGGRPSFHHNLLLINLSD